MNLNISLRDLNSKPLVSTKVLFTELLVPNITASYVVPAETKTLITDNSGSISASMVAGNYKLDISKPLPVSYAYWNVTEDTSSLISGSALTGSSQIVSCSFIDIVKDPFSIKKVSLTPSWNYPKFFSGSLYLLSTTSSFTDNSGSCIFDALIPGIIQVDAIGKVTTTFFISVPAWTNSASLDGSWNIKDLIVVKPAKATSVKLNNADNSYVLTVSSSDARYASRYGVNYNNESSSYSDNSANAISSSYGLSSSYSIYATDANSASYSVTSSYAESSSFSNKSISASYALSSSYSFVEPNYSASVSTIIDSKQNTIVTGNTYTITSSWSNTATSASYAPFTQATQNSCSFASSSISASFALASVSCSYASNVPDTASYALLAKTSSYISTASYSSISLTSSYAPIEPVSSASIVSQLGSKQPNLITGNTYTITSSYAEKATYALSANVANSCISATSAAYSDNAITASYSPVQPSFSASISSIKQNALITGNTYSITSSWSNNSVSSSYAPVQPSYSASISSIKQNTLITGNTYNITSSWSNKAISASYSNNAISASWTTYAEVAGDVAYASECYQATAAFSANSASYAPVQPSYSASISSIKQNTLITGTTYTITSSWSNNSVNAITSSYSLLALTSSYTATASLLLGSIENSLTSTSSSYSLNSTSASYAGFDFVKSGSVNDHTSNIVVISVATGSYQAAFFDYYVYNGGGNLRAGTIISGWYGSNIDYNEVTTADIGITSDITLTVALSSGNVQLLSSAQVGEWNVKAVARMI